MKKTLLTGTAYMLAGATLVVIGGGFGFSKAILAYRMWTLGLLAFFLSFAAWVGIWRLTVELAGYINVRYGKPMINGLTQKGWGVLLGLSLICSLVFPLTFNGDWLHFPLIRAEEGPWTKYQKEQDDWEPYTPSQKQLSQKSKPVVPPFIQNEQPSQKSSSWSWSWPELHWPEFAKSYWCWGGGPNGWHWVRAQASDKGCGGFHSTIFWWRVD